MKKLTEKGILDSQMKKLMTPKAVADLQDLSPTMQQFLIRWQESRDEILGTQLRDELTRSVSDAVSKDLAETILPIITVLGEIRTDLAEIKMQLRSLKTEMIELELRVKHLETLNSIWIIGLRIGIGVFIAWLLHQWFMK
jgi:hypothetical protein